MPKQIFIGTAMMFVGIVGLATTGGRASVAQPSPEEPKPCDMACNDLNYCGIFPVYNRYFEYQGLLQGSPKEPDLGLCKVWYWKNAAKPCNRQWITDHTPHPVEEEHCKL